MFHLNPPRFIFTWQPSSKFCKKYWFSKNCRIWWSIIFNNLFSETSNTRNKYDNQ